MSLEKTLATRLLGEHPDEAAAVLEGLPEEVTVSVLADAPSETASQVLARLAPHRAAVVLGGFEPSLGNQVVAHLGFDATADLIRRMEQERRERFVAVLEPELARPIRTLLQFSQGTAGSLMDSRVLALPLDVTAGEAIARIRKTPDNVRYNLYVMDRERRLVGVLNLRELMLAEPTARLGSIARHDVLSIDAHADQNAVMSHRAWREAHSLPVVDRAGVYLGAIRYRTWRLLVEEAARDSERRDPTTADALGDLFWTGMAGVIGAFAHVAASPTAGSTDGRD